MVQVKRGLFFTIALLIFYASCDKVEEDKIPPVILLNGRSPDTVLVGCPYNDPGAITTDDGTEHGYTVSGEVISDTSGVYFLDYTAWDADSNFAFEQRMVVVENLTPDSYVGNYAAFDTLIFIPREITKYNVEIDLISQEQNLYRISNFGNFGTGFQVLFQPDSLGSFELTYNNSDTIVEGSGNVKCDYTGLHLDYFIETTETFETHKATYRK